MALVDAQGSARRITGVIAHRAVANHLGGGIRRPRRIQRRRAGLDEDTLRPAEEPGAEATGQIRLQVSQCGHPLAGERAMYELICPPGGGGPSAGAEAERVDLAEAGLAGEVERGLEVGFRLAREADENVAGDGGAIQSAAETVHMIFEVDSPECAWGDEEVTSILSMAISTSLP